MPGEGARASATPRPQPWPTTWPLPGRRADRGPAGGAPGAGLALVPAQPGGGRAAGRWSSALLLGVAVLDACWPCGRNAMPRWRRQCRRGRRSQARRRPGHASAARGRMTPPRAEQDAPASGQGQTAETAWRLARGEGGRARPASDRASRRAGSQRDPGGIGRSPTC